MKFLQLTTIAILLIAINSNAVTANGSSELLLEELLDEMTSSEELSDLDKIEADRKVFRK